MNRVLVAALIVVVILGTTAVAWFALTPDTSIMIIPVKEMSDTEYPDDPDNGTRAPSYMVNAFRSLQLNAEDGYLVDMHIDLHSGEHVVLNDLDLSEWIPTIPERLRGNEYLGFLAILNQEWNRNQVRFSEGEFVSTKGSVTRVDVARNCLNAYLWEVILYSNASGEERVMAHGWFDMPTIPYQRMFAERNDVPFGTFSEHLEEWREPERRMVNRNDIRSSIGSVPVTFTDLSDAPYPMQGERARKRKEVVHPVLFNTMRDLQSDSSTFATFSPPGDRRAVRSAQNGTGAFMQA